MPFIIWFLVSWDVWIMVRFQCLYWTSSVGASGIEQRDGGPKYTFFYKNSMREKDILIFIAFLFRFFAFFHNIQKEQYIMSKILILQLFWTKIDIFILINSHKYPQIPYDAKMSSQYWHGTFPSTWYYYVTICECETNRYIILNDFIRSTNWW